MLRAWSSRLVTVNLVVFVVAVHISGRLLSLGEVMNEAEAGSK